MFDLFKNRLELVGTLTTVTALRVGAGRSSEPIGTDLPVIKDALSRPLIPGSSFKGALRSRLESFLRAINKNYAKDPTLLVDESDNIQKIKEQYKDDDEQLTQALLKRTDEVSYIFGAPWLAGKLQVRDLSVLPNAWFGQYQERNGVAIDRDTETASSGKLYDFQVVPANTPFHFQAVMENATDWELGLLMMGLSQFEQGQIPLGGGRSRGLGVVELVITRMYWHDVRKPGTEEPDPSRTLAYLQHLAASTEHQEENINTSELKNIWVQALITHLSTNLAIASHT